MIEEKCVCGHVKDLHVSDYIFDKVPCGGCIFKWQFNPERFCQDFKLDNLQFIEDLAKEKNLI